MPILFVKTHVIHLYSIKSLPCQIGFRVCLNNGGVGPAQGLELPINYGLIDCTIFLVGGGTSPPKIRPRDMSCLN